MNLLLRLVLRGAIVLLLIGAFTYVGAAVSFASDASRRTKKRFGLQLMFGSAVLWGIAFLIHGS